MQCAAAPAATIYISRALLHTIPHTITPAMTMTSASSSGGRGNLQLLVVVMCAAGLMLFCSPPAFAGPVPGDPNPYQASGRLFQQHSSHITPADSLGVDA